MIPLWSSAAGIPPSTARALALRGGAKNVKLLYRRTQEEMPAEPNEVEEAIREGVEMLFLMAPIKITMENGNKKLRCIKMELGEPDRSGRRRPIPVEGSEFDIDCGHDYRSHWSKYQYTVSVS